MKFAEQPAATLIGIIRGLSAIYFQMRWRTLVPAREQHASQGI